MPFNSTTIKINDTTAVSLRFVESMEFPGGEDSTVDVLSSDAHLKLVTTSGNQYNISMTAVRHNHDISNTVTNRGLRVEIYNKWTYLQGN
jgi:hypothetical protein